MLQSRFKKQQVALVSLNRPKFRVHLSRLQRPVGDGFPNCFATATQLLCQLTNGQHRKSPRLDLLANLQVKLSSQRSRDTFCCFANRLRLLALLHLNAQIALLCCDKRYDPATKATCRSLGNELNTVIANRFARKSARSFCFRGTHSNRTSTPRFSASRSSLTAPRKAG